MRCFSSKKSLVLLSCVAAAIVLVCGGMVVTAYVSWKHRKEAVTNVQVSGETVDHAVPLDHGRRHGYDRNDQASSAAAAADGDAAAARASGVLQDVLRLRACANRRLLELKKSQDELQHPAAGRQRGHGHHRYVVDSDDTTGTDDGGDGIVSSGSGDGPEVRARLAAHPSASTALDQGARAELQQRDACEHALQCNNDPFLVEYMRKLADLPTCPCFYPTESASLRPAAATGSGGGSSQQELWDDSRQRNFYWKLAPYTTHQLSVYHSGAHRCIWSVASPSGGTLAAQSCCYDAQSRLITRGPGAGTPMLISPDISPELHFALDRLPWLTCGGDWTRYNSIRPPNNGRKCHEVPNQIEYLYLALKAKDTR